MATLFSGQSLYPGQSLQSNSGLHTLIMQTDGNVVLYDRNSQPLWATNTGGLITPREFIMQTDGNLVLYDKEGCPKWASQTYGNPGAFFNVQDDGNLVVYRYGAQTETAENALWAAGCNDWAGQGGQGGQGGQNAFAQEILAAHNRYRAEVGVPPLQWSDQLAADAQPWANYLTTLGGIQLIHSNAPGQGECLFGGSPPGAFGLTRMVDDWGSEKQSFAPGPFTNVGFDGGVIGHYTQMIWRDTTHVGCAIANNGQEEFLVCRYSPQGNIIGQYVP